MYKKFMKRVMDFILSLFALLFLFPILIILIFLIKIKLGSPVIFKQKRPGKNEKIFTMYKFRTMTDEKDENGDLLPDNIRLTKLGKLLRSTSLDELPELINILKGDMSIVGPRPQLIKDLVFMSEEQRKRHTVLPGLSGLAQINGRNCLSWEEKLEYDLLYIENITFFKDCKIIINTIKKVFMKSDINSEGMATAEDFGDYLLRIGKINKDKYSMLLEESRKINILN
ncbi:MAG: UDP-galactose phosphate transferase [Clostridia bacterium]|nr:UDP-galactose phosphate transferase [Clostridia bacterium]